MSVISPVSTTSELREEEATETAEEEEVDTNLTWRSRDLELVRGCRWWWVWRLSLRAASIIK